MARLCGNSAGLHGGSVSLTKNDQIVFCSAVIIFVFWLIFFFFCGGGSAHVEARAIFGSQWRSTMRVPGSKLR